MSVNANVEELLNKTLVEELLNKTLDVLPVTNEDVVFKGITAKVTDRIVELKKSALRLKEKYGSLGQLEKEIKQQGVSPDEHSLYTDLLQWRAIKHELTELFEILEAF